MRIFLLLLLLQNQSLLAQKIIINGAEGNRLLKWDDFAGTPDNSSSFLAYASYNTKLKFDNVEFNGDKAIIKGFQITLELDATKSWVKKGKESDELLKHEQGHFDVGLLYIQEVLEKIASTGFSRSSYQQEFKKLMNDIHEKYSDMGKQYDSETGHSTIKNEQEKWDRFFQEKVKR